MTNREYTYVKKLRTPRWSPSKGLPPSHVQLLDAMLLAGTSKKALARHLNISTSTVGDVLKTISKRYNLHGCADIILWWSQWITCYAVLDNKTKPLMPEKMWPFSERGKKS